MPASLFALTDQDNAVYKKLCQIEAYCEKGQIKKAKQLLKIVKKEIVPDGIDCESSSAICRRIAYCETLIMDKEKTFDDYPFFIGRIVEIVGNIGGLITVKGKKETRVFYYDYNIGLITENDDSIGQWKGQFVKIYYDSGPFGLTDEPVVYKIVFLTPSKKKKRAPTGNQSNF